MSLLESLEKATGRKLKKDNSFTSQKTTQQETRQEEKGSSLLESLESATGRKLVQRTVADATPTRGGSASIKHNTDGRRLGNQGRDYRTELKNAAREANASKNYKIVLDKYNKDPYGKGNIDLRLRPMYRNEDGTISTVSSMSFNEDGKEILVPTIAFGKDGKPIKLTEQEAINRYRQTGEHLGMFNTVDEANRYANLLHQDQQAFISSGQELVAGTKMTKEQEERLRIELEEYEKEKARETPVFGNTPDIETVASMAGYTGEKLLAGAVDGISDAGSYLLAGAATIGRPFTWGSWNEALKNEADYYLRLANNGLGDQWIKRIDKRYDKTPQAYKDNVGDTWAAIGSLLPGIATEVVTGGTAPTQLDVVATKGLGTLLKGALKRIRPADVYLFSSAAGSSAGAAYEKTGDLGKSMAYGALNGLGEVFTEKLFGGIGGTNVGDELIDLGKIPGIRKIANTKVGGKVLDVVMEGVEEGLMALADPYFQRLTVDPNAEWRGRDVGESTKQGILLSVLLNAMLYPVNRHTRTRAIKNINSTTDAINAVLENDADKFEPLSNNATEEEIKKRQSEIKTFRSAYVEIMNENLDFLRSEEGKGTLEALVTEGKEKGVGSASEQIAMEIENDMRSGKEITREQVQKLIIANEEKVQTPASPEAESQTPANVVQPHSRASQAKSSIEQYKAAMEQAKTKPATTGNMSSTLYAETLTKSGQAITVEEAMAASGFGVEGAKVLADYVDKNRGVPFSMITGETRIAYLAGRSKKTDFNAETDLQEQMFRAGYRDRSMANVLAEQSKPTYVVFDGKESGMPMKNGKVVVPEGVSKPIATALHYMGQDFAYKMQFDDAIIANLKTGKMANAQTDADARTLTFAKNSKKPLHKVVAHEGTHVMENEDTEAYRIFSDFAVQKEEQLDLRAESGVSTGTNFEYIHNQYENAGLEMNATKNIGEITARFAERLIGNDLDAKMLIKEMNQNEDTRNALRRFFDAVEKIIWKLQRTYRRLFNQGEYAAAKEIGMTIEELEQARKLWQESYKATEKAVEQKKDTISSNSLEIKTEKDYNKNVKYALSGNGGKGKTNNYQMKVFPPYDESQSDANEISTRWAHREDVDERAMKIAFYHDGIYLIEKTSGSDLGYQIIRKITKKEYDKWLQKNRRVRDDKDTGKQHNRKGVNQSRGGNRRNDTDGGVKSGSNRDSFRYRGKVQDVSEVDSYQEEWRRTEYERNGDYEYRFQNKQKSIGITEASTDAKVSYSLDENDSGLNIGENVQGYTDEEYRDYGWARENGILTADQNADYRSKFAMAKSGQMKFPKSKRGEYIIPVSDIYDTDKEGINNVLVFAKGTIDKPVITSIIEIYEYDETSLDEKRRAIYESERRGIQPETEDVFGRYDSIAFRDRRSRTVFKSDGNNSDNGYRGGSGEEASGTERGVGEEGKGVSFSLQEEWHTDLTKAQVKMVEGWLRRAGSPEATRITDTANWYMGRLNGSDLFVIYSTEDTKGPTILYETRENAKIEKNILMDILEDEENGKSANRESSFTERLFEGDWDSYVGNSQNNIQRVGTGTNGQDAGVLPRQPKCNASRAFWNVLENLFEIQESRLNETYHSLMDDIEVSPRRTKELLDTIAYLKEQMNVTKFAKADPRKLKAITRKLLREYASEYDLDKATASMEELYRYMANGEDGHPAAWDETYRRAKEIATQIAENAVTVDSNDWTTYQGLREYLRTTKMYVNPENFGDASGFHRRNFGRILVTTKDRTAMGVDEFFQELAEFYPEFFNEDKAGTYSDKLYMMEEVLDSLKPLEFNPYANDMEMAITSIANDVIQNFFAVPQAKPTFADRAEQRVAKARAESKQLVAAQRERTKRDLAKARESKEKALAKERDKQKTRLSKMSEERRARVLRAQITRSVGSLSQKLVKATDKKHIPKELQEAVTALLYNINLESNYTYNPETGTYHKNDEGLPTNKTKAFRELKKVYQSIAEKNDYGLVLAPELLGASDYGIGNCFDEVMELSDKRIADMTVEELTKVYDVVRLVEHSVLTAGKMFALQKWETLDEVGKAFQKSTATRRPKHALMESHFLLDIETPLTFFSHFGDAGNEFYRALRNAQDREQVMQNELTEVVNKVVSREFVEKAGKELYEFETMGGEKLTLSKAHIMNIYLLSKREQGLKHLIYDEDNGYFGNGIHQPKVGKIRRSAESIRLNKMDLGKILEVIQKDEEAKKICDGLQKATGLLAKWGNEASMRVFGYEKFKDPNYWTIKVASEGVHQTVDKNNDKPRSIKNMGSAKAVENKVSNSLEIDDVFTVFARHSSDMLCYSAWLEIMEDASRLYNYQFLDDAGGNTGKSFQSMLDKYAGEGGSKYFFRLMGDIQNGLSAPADTATEEIWKKIYGNAQRAAVGGNLRVIVQQPTSLTRAATVLNSTSILGAIGEGVAVKPTLDGWKKAVKYAPIAARKAVGGYEIGANAKGLSDEFYKPDTTKGKVKHALSEAAFWGAGKADELTWGVIWNACEIEVNKNKSLQKGSEEYYNAVAELFTKVIDETQVVDGVLQRSQAMRTSAGVIKQMTAFTGEPTQGFNIVMRAYDALRYETEPAKRTKAKKMLGRAVCVHMLTSITTALAASLVDAIRDDGEEDYWEKFWKAFSGIQGDEETWFDYVTNFLLKSNVTDNLNPLNFIPLLKDFMSLAQGFNVERMDASVIGDLGRATGEFVMALAGEGKKTVGYAGWNVLLRGAKVFGKSPYNFIRDLEGVIRTAQVETGNLKAWYKTEKMRTKPSTNTDAYIDALYKAYETDNDAYEYIYNDMIKSGVKASTIQKKMEEHMKSAEGVKKVEDLSKRYMPPADEKKYDKSMKQISSSRVWKSANATQKKEAKDGLYNFLTSTSEAMEKTRAEARAMGVDETEYTLWQLAKEMVNDDKESMNATEKAAAIELLDLGDAELAYFYNTETADKAYAGGVSMENFAKFKAAVSGLKGSDKKAKVLSAAERYAGNTKDWLFFMGSEYSSYKKRSDYISYFGK